MSAHKSIRLLFDKGCAVSFGALVALRCVQCVAFSPESFYSAAGQLRFCFLYTTPQGLVCCALVPLFAPCVTGLLRHALTAHLMVRHGARTAIVSSLLPCLSVRALVYSATLVITGLVTVFLRSGYVFEPIGYVTFALVNIVLETTFFYACGLVVIAVYLQSQSMALPVCAMALYGAIDYLVSFVIKSNDPSFCVGWGLTMVGPGFDLGMGAMCLARLAAIAVLLGLLCLRRVRSVDLFDVGVSTRTDSLTSPGAHDCVSRLYLPPVRRSLLARLAICVCVQGCSALYLSQYGCVTAVEYLLAGNAFVPRGPGQVALLVFVASLLPFASYLYCFGDYVKQALGREGKYVLPRVGSRVGWAVGILIELLLFSVAFVILGSLVCLAALIPFGVMGYLGEAFAVALRAMPLAVLMTLVLTCAANLLSLLMEAVASCLTVLLAHAGALMALCLVPSPLSEVLVPIIPSAQGVLAWHDCASWSRTLTSGVEGFGVSWSAVYLVLLAVVLGAYLARRTARADVF